MPAPSWENLDVFLVPDSLGGFATYAVLTSADGTASAPFTGIFEDPTIDPVTGTFGFDIAEPRFLCKSADAEPAERFDRLLVGPLVGGVIVGGTEYQVSDRAQHDGTGMAYIRVNPLTEGV